MGLHDPKHYLEGPSDVPGAPRAAVQPQRDRLGLGPADGSLTALAPQISLGYGQFEMSYWMVGLVTILTRADTLCPRAHVYPVSGPCVGHRQPILHSGFGSSLSFLNGMSLFLRRVTGFGNQTSMGRRACLLFRFSFFISPESFLVMPTTDYPTEPANKAA